MSMDLASERVCYVHCNFCNTFLAVSVPSSNMLSIVTVRCGHCSNLLSVNIASSVQTHVPLQEQPQVHKLNINTQDLSKTSGSSSKYSPFETEDCVSPRMPPPIRPPEKRQRLPSAYNRFIKEEIQRIKASNPDITHREAFSTAAKNWAHFPHIHFGLKLDGGNKKGKTLADQSNAQESNALFNVYK